MSIAVTLLMSSGDPDPHWTLTPEQEQEFLNRLAASPVPSVVVGPPGRRAGYAGITVRDGAGNAGSSIGVGSAAGPTRAWTIGA